jgi:hypothetical protein
MRSIPAMMEITQPRTIIIHGLQDIMSAIQAILQHMPPPSASSVQPTSGPAPFGGPAAFGGPGPAAFGGTATFGSPFSSTPGSAMQFDEPPPFQKEQPAQQQQTQTQGQALPFQQQPSRSSNGRMSEEESEVMAKRLADARAQEDLFLQSRPRPI